MNLLPVVLSALLGVTALTVNVKTERSAAELLSFKRHNPCPSNLLQRANQELPRRRVVCTRAQGLFAHATTPGAPTIAVTQAKMARCKHICASDPENVCTLLAASPAK